MKSIDIEITKARLVNLSITFPEDVCALPDVTATITLYGANDKQITSYAIQTDDYSRKYAKNRYADLPDDALPLLGRVRDIMEQVVAAHCMGQFKQLPLSMEVNADDIPF